MEQFVAAPWHYVGAAGIATALLLVPLGIKMLALLIAIAERVAFEREVNRVRADRGKRNA